MNYYVTYKISGEYTSVVEASTPEEALSKSKEDYWDADFGDCHEIDAEAVMIEDENGNIVKEL